MAERGPRIADPRERGHDIEFYNDTLWVMTSNNWVDGLYNSGGVYYLHETYDDTCSVPLSTGADRPFPPAATILVQQDHFVLLGATDGPAAYTLVDGTGRAIQRGLIMLSGDRSLPVSLHDHATGLYHLHVVREGQVLFRGSFVKW